MELLEVQPYSKVHPFTFNVFAVSLLEAKCNLYREVTVRDRIRDTTRAQEATTPFTAKAARAFSRHRVAH